MVGLVQWGGGAFQQCGRQLRHQLCLFCRNTNTRRPVTLVIVQPAGPAWTNSQLGQLVNGINQTRANTNLFPLQAFAHVGDILATPQFTEQSPFLHWNNGTLFDYVQLTNGISDEMYEWLPQQTMSLLRCSSSPRYVIYCYGQALKPAPNSVYTGTTHRAISA